MPDLAAESASVGRLRRALGAGLIDSVRANGEETAIVSPAAAPEALRLLRDDPGSRMTWLADLTACDRLGLDPDPSARFAVVYHLANLSTCERLRVRTHLPAAEPRLATAVPLWPSADWLEREVFDLYGVQFEGHPDLRRILLPDDYDGHPLRKDYPLRGRGERMELQRTAGAPPHFRQPVPETGRPEEPGDLEQPDRLEEFRRGRVAFTEVKGAPGETMLLNFGPQHPAMHGTLRVVMELDGERILRAAPELGFLHTGFEKLGEYRKWNDFITLTDRTNYLSPIANNFGYCIAVEKLMGLEIPPRAQAIRVILAELARISDHLLCVGTQALDIGAFTAFLYGFRDRELLYDIFEAVSGARFTVSYGRIGGVATDVPEDFVPMVRSFLAKCPGTIDEIATLLDRNRIWLDRTRGVGVVTPEQAVNWSLSGPCLRASGIAHDLRQAEPYSGYDQYDFDVVIGQNGDVFDRYIVRMEEMRQSLRIIEQALSRLPDGPWMSADERVAIPDKSLVYGSIEGLIYQFKQIMDGHGFQPEPGEAYGVSEAPNGELGYYVVSGGTNHPHRVRIRPPSIFHYQLLPELLKGRLISDSVAILGSLNVIAGELDR